MARQDVRVTPPLWNTCGKTHQSQCWFFTNAPPPQDNRQPWNTTAALYPEEVDVDAFQLGRSDDCWECGALVHRRSQCPILKRRWAQGRLHPGSHTPLEPPNTVPTANHRGGVTLTEVHGVGTNIPTITADVVTTRSKATPKNHVVEHRKPFPDNHWERLHTLRTDMQQELESAATEQKQPAD